jgi:hypothetical protein
MALDSVNIADGNTPYRGTTLPFQSTRRSPP